MDKSVKKAMALWKRYVKKADSPQHALELLKERRKDLLAQLAILDVAESMATLHCRYEPHGQLASAIH